ncbi:hypothetical protein EDD99_1769 [Streptomyces sp. 846.5]|nr:hypothetical protein [Streptomyces sp. 846.5]TDU03347.1 hypothetical protein EDD99_1769 [Streptomyces sp. 846.5]
MAHIDDEKPQVEDEALEGQEAPEVVAHGIDDATLDADGKCTVYVKI